MKAGKSRRADLGRATNPWNKPMEGLKEKCRIGHFPKRRCRFGTRWLKTRKDGGPPGRFEFPGVFLPFSAAGREVQESEPAAGKNCSFYCKNYAAGVFAVRDSGSGRRKFPIRPPETWRPRRRPHSDPASDGGKFCSGSAPSAGQKAKAPVHGSARPSPLTEAGRLTKSICESLKDSANLM